MYQESTYSSRPHMQRAHALCYSALRESPLYYFLSPSGKYIQTSQSSHIEWTYTMKRSHTHTHKPFAYIIYIMGTRHTSMWKLSVNCEPNNITYPIHLAVSWTRLVLKQFILSTHQRRPCGRESSHIIAKGWCSFVARFRSWWVVFVGWF